MDRLTWGCKDDGRRACELPASFLDLRTRNPSSCFPPSLLQVPIISFPVHLGGLTFFMCRTDTCPTPLLLSIVHFDVLGLLPEHSSLTHSFSYKDASRCLLCGRQRGPCPCDEDPPDVPRESALREPVSALQKLWESFITLLLIVKRLSSESRDLAPPNRFAGCGLWEALFDPASARNGT